MSNLLRIFDAYDFERTPYFVLNYDILPSSLTFGVPLDINQDIIMVIVNFMTIFFLITLLHFYFEYESYFIDT